MADGFANIVTAHGGAHADRDHASRVSPWSIQATVPTWVRARALALYLLTFQGSMAAGSGLGFTGAA